MASKNNGGFMNSAYLFPFAGLGSGATRARSRKPRDIFDLMAGVFDENYGGRFWPKESQPSTFLPNLQVQETEQEVLVLAELPGLNREDFEVEFVDQGLRISGEKKETHSSKEGDAFHYSETRYGKFERIIPLNTESLKIGDESASYTNGVLQVRIPKTSEALKKNRKIEVA
jgi:HSP20 family protein